MLGGGGGTYISRYGRCCFEIWEVLCWGGRGAKVSRYGRCCFEIWEGLCGGWEYKHFEIWEVLFRDMRDAVSIYERCCFEIWEVLFRDMGGADYSQRQYSCPAPYSVFRSLFPSLISRSLGLWWSDFRNSKVCIIPFSWPF